MICLKNLRIVHLLTLSWLVSCSSGTYLGKQEYRFGGNASKIVWLQIAGFDEEHLALLKISQEMKRTSFESMACHGKAWKYNLYDLRPGVTKSYLTQVAGTYNVKDDCSSLKGQSLWNSKYFKDNSANLIVGNPPKSKCNLNDFVAGSATVRMAIPSKAIPEEHKFHFQDGAKLSKGFTMYDKNCFNGQCFSTIRNNANSIYEILAKKDEKLLLTITDFTYSESLKKKNITKAKEILEDINKLIDGFLTIAAKDDEMLVLVTSLNSQGIEFPKSGADWKNFDLEGKGLFYHKEKLIAPVYASGARAENFCSMLNESEIIQTIFWQPKKKGWREILNAL